MFVTISKKTIIICGVIAFSLIGVIASALLKTEYVYIPKSEYIVVIDAGHGGIDGGSVGTSTGIKESELNLAYSLNLKRQLESIGVGVILTRTSEAGLYEQGVKNLKKSDMQKRKSIIENSNANLVVSLHMNSFRLKSSYGAQAFYKKNSQSGKELADAIQSQFIGVLNSPKKTALSGDYFMVNCTDLPSVILECGFLSNEKEEKLLLSYDYQTKVCYSILCGIVDFLNLA